MSGFYVEDIPAIREKAESLGMTFVHHREKNRWVAVSLLCNNIKNFSIFSGKMLKFLFFCTKIRKLRTDFSP